MQESISHFSSANLELGTIAAASESGVSQALVEWEKILGADRVNRHAVSNTIGVNTMSFWELTPSNRQQVSPVVAAAAKYGVSLYPISTGNNWGYGSKTPVDSRSCILNLRELAEVRFVDQDLGLVSVEPGVTQQALYEFLQEHGSDLMVPVHGGGPTCSILGNALERGYGLTPVCDHFQSLTSLSAVLADGSEYESPLSQIGPGWLQAHRWGIGPYMDGLFSQGNFGVVTRATFALETKPEHVEALVLKLNDQDLEPAVKLIQSALRNCGGQLTGMNLMNARRVLSMSSRYPIESVGQNEIISEELLANMKAKSGVSDWVLIGVIHCAKRMRRSLRREVISQIPVGIGRPVFLNERRVASLRRLMSYSPIQSRLLSTQLDSIHSLLQIATGVPQQVALPLAYWLEGEELDHKRQLDPARDLRGLIWFSPLVPMKGSEVRRFSELVEYVCAQHKIEPLITLTTLSDRLFDATVPLLFRRNEQGAAERAQACYEALREESERIGFVPYRLPVSSMESFGSKHKLASWTTASKLQTALDPGAIVSPGRYSMSKPR